jgi:hypothetical protein
MRALLSVLAIMAFAAPAFAAENIDTQKPTLIKGSKSYQVRYSKPASMKPEMVEPAAGVDTDKTSTEDMSAIATSSNENGYGKKVMKLHGKK